MRWLPAIVLTLAFPMTVLAAPPADGENQVTFMASYTDIDSADRGNKASS